VEQNAETAQQLLLADRSVPHASGFTPTDCVQGATTGNTSLPRCELSDSLKQLSHLHIYGHVGGWANEPETSVKQLQNCFTVLFQFCCTGIRTPAMKLKQNYFYFNFMSDVNAA
jgi:hypothetical protein